MMIQDNEEQLLMVVTKLGHYPIVLGIPWLWLHNVAVQFASNMVNFESRYCTTQCQNAPVTVQGVTEKSPEPVYTPRGGIFEPRMLSQRPFWGNIVMLNRSSFFGMVKKGSLQYSKGLYMT